MLTAISRYGEQQIVIRPRRKTVQTLSDGSTYAGIDTGLCIQFSSLAEPFTTTLLPAVNGKQQALGILDIEQTSKDHGLLPHEMEKILRKHPGNAANGGNTFAIIEEDGSEIVSEDTYIVKEGSSFYCKLCAKRIMSEQGVATHKSKSKKHAIALAEAETAALNKLN